MARARLASWVSASASALLFGLSTSAWGESEPSLARAEQHLGVAAFEEAAAELELFAMDVPGDPRASVALERALSLRIALGEDIRATRDEALLWRALPVPSSAAPHGAVLAAMRATLALARSAYANQDMGRAKEVLEGRLAEIDRSGTPELRAEAHGLTAQVLAVSGDRRRAAEENAKVVALAKRTEGDLRIAWGEGAREAAAEARLAFAAVEEAKVARLTLAPYRGPKERSPVRAYLEGVVLPWVERTMPAVEAAERAYARVLGVEIPAPSLGGGDPNAPVAPFDVDPATRPGARLSARGVVIASARMGALWASLREVLASVPSVPHVSNGCDGEYETAR
ncbi:MAG: hypothetical protein JNM74_09640, partial [Myxococcales bacterium]|nr:hypothetical protein [Myxococcales bacterium]